MKDRLKDALGTVLFGVLFGVMIIACNIIALYIWEAAHSTPPRRLISDEMAEGWDMAVTMCNRNMADCVLSSVRTPPATSSGNPDTGRTKPVTEPQ